MDNERIELVASQDSPTGQAGRKVNGAFEPVVVDSPTSAVPEVLSSGQMQDQTDFDLPETAPDTSASSELARFEFGTKATDDFVKGLSEQAQQSASAEGSAFVSYINNALNQTTEAELQDAAFREDTGFGSVDELRATITDYNNQIKGEQVALSRKLEKLEKNPGGLSSDQLSAIMADEERASLRKQADIAILQEASLGKYLNALDIANRSIDAQLSTQERDLNILGLIYERNKTLFDRDEQRMFATILSDRLSTLEEEKYTRRLLESTKLSIMQQAQAEGAPQDVWESIQKETTPEGVISAAGNWLGKTDRNYKNLQMLKLNAEYNKLMAELSGVGTEEGIISPEMREKIGKFAPAQTAVAQIGLSGRMKDLYDKIDKYGSINPTDVDARREINSARSALMLEIANAFGQGAIQAGDRDQYEAILGTNWQTAEGVKSAISEGILQIHGQAKTNIDLTKATYPEAANWEPFTQHLTEVELDNYLKEQLAQYEVTVDPTESAIAQFLSGKSGAMIPGFGI